jgi:predicted RNase H-like HicB family nuclease
LEEVERNMHEAIDMHVRGLLEDELLEEMDYQRDALQRDVAWGLQNA